MMSIYLRGALLLILATITTADNFIVPEDAADVTNAGDFSQNPVYMLGETQEFLWNTSSPYVTLFLSQTGKDNTDDVLCDKCSGGSYTWDGSLSQDSDGVVFFLRIYAWLDGTVPLATSRNFNMSNTSSSTPSIEPILSSILSSVLTLSAPASTSSASSLLPPATFISFSTSSTFTPSSSTSSPPSPPVIKTPFASTTTTVTRTPLPSSNSTFNPPLPSSAQSNINNTSTPHTHTTLAIPLGIGLGLGLGFVILIAAGGALFEYRRQKKNNKHFSVDHRGGHEAVREVYEKAELGAGAAKEVKTDLIYEKAELPDVEPGSVGGGAGGKGVEVEEWVRSELPAGAC